MLRGLEGEEVLEGARGSRTCGRQFTAAREAAVGQRGGGPVRSPAQPLHECVAAPTDNIHKQALSIQFQNTCTYYNIYHITIFNKSQ